MNTCLIETLSDIAIAITGILGAGVGLIQYKSVSKNKALEQELENLRGFFKAIEDGNSVYKKTQICYPTNMATEYEYH